MSYNWRQPDWPEARYELASAADFLLALADPAWRIGGLLEALP